MSNIILWLEGKVDESRINLLKVELRDRENVEVEKNPIFWSISMFPFLGIYIYYFLTEDFYRHDKREAYMLCDIHDAMENIGIAFLIPIKHREMPKRNIILYVILTLLTGIFGIYWLYILFKEPNEHFTYQREWENKLLETLTQQTSPGITTPYSLPITDITPPATICLKRADAMLVLPGRMIEISQDETLYGRSDFENDISIDYINFISKKEDGKYHFKILKQKGLFYIQDQSTNGTILNNIEIKGKGMKELKNDDQITLAGINNFIITFKISTNAELRK